MIPYSNLMVNTQVQLNYIIITLKYQNYNFSKISLMYFINFNYKYVHYRVSELAVVRDVLKKYIDPEQADAVHKQRYNDGKSAKHLLCIIIHGCLETLTYELSSWTLKLISVGLCIILYFLCAVQFQLKTCVKCCTHVWNLGYTNV